MTRVSFDTQIIIALLTNNASGHRGTAEWVSIRRMAASIRARKMALVLPTLVVAELLPSHHGPAIQTFLSQAIEFRLLTVEIARRAAELRDLGKRSLGRKLKTVDSIFIATAESAACDCLYSSDSDIYNATGARVRLAKPGSAQISFLPGTALPLPCRERGAVALAG